MYYAHYAHKRNLPGAFFRDKGDCGDEGQQDGETTYRREQPCAAHRYHKIENEEYRVADWELPCLFKIDFKRKETRKNRNVSKDERRAQLSPFEPDERIIPHIARSVEETPYAVSPKGCLITKDQQ